MEEFVKIPLYWMNGQFDLAEIGTLVVLTASPELNTDTQKMWGDLPEFKNNFNDLRADGYIEIGEDGLVLIHSEPKPMGKTPMTVSKIMDFLTSGDFDITDREDRDDCQEWLEELASDCYRMGYDDRKLDDVHVNTSYGKTEDFE